jgi:photosystem II stability/assembly factor-like uncharacterized protein
MTKINRHNFLYKIAFSLLFLIFYNVYLFSQSPSYLWQNPIPQGNPLFKIIAFDTTNAMAVGSVGTLMNTSNGGASWSHTNKITYYNIVTGLPQNMELVIYSIYFTDRSWGYAVGNNGLIIHSSDGGSTWLRQFAGTSSNLQSIYFINSNVGWIAGWDGVILKTTDGGASWITQISNTQAQMHSIYFANADTGWAVGERGVSGGASIAELLRTTDGGATWDKINLGINNRLWGLRFNPKSKYCYITGWSGYIGKSIDYGSTFVRTSTDMSILIYSVDFPSEKIGYAAGEYGTLLKSTNGGDTWNNLPTVQSDHIYSITFLDTLVGWFAGDYGIIYKTRDGGNTWEKQTNRSPGVGLTKEILAVDFIGSSGWAVGEKGLILKTTNNGTNWTEIQSPVTNKYNSVKFATSQIGYIAGNNGKIMKLSNGEESWTDLNVPNLNYYGIYFTSQSIGYAVANNETIIKTTDEGATWNIIHTGPSIQLNSVYFISKDTGWAAGYNVILMTTDGGTTWNETRNVGIILNIKFFNRRVGWASTSDKTIYKTTDGGKNWTAQNSGFNGEITYLSVIDSLNVWATVNQHRGDSPIGGQLIYTTNGGDSWSYPLQTNTSNFLNCSYFVDKYMGILFGKGCTIMRYSGKNQTTLICDPVELQFFAPHSGPLPESKYVIVNSLGGAMNWSYVQDQVSWLSVTRNLLDLSKLDVYMTTTDLPPDSTYTAFITVSDPNAWNTPQTVKISYTVYTPGNRPEISFGNIDTLRFEAEKDGPLPPDDTITITNAGKGTMSWETSKDTNWFDLSPSRGIDSTNVIVSVNTTGLSINPPHKGKLTISSLIAVNSPRTINVLYTIYPPPTITFSDTSLNFQAVQKGPLPGSKSIRLNNPGRRPYSWVATKQNPSSGIWFNFTPETGINNDSITVNITTTDLPVGKYPEKIVFTSPEAANNGVTLTINYNILPVSILSFPQDSVVFPNTELGDSRDITVPISNPGTGVLTVSSQTFSGQNPDFFNPVTPTPLDVKGNGGSQNITFRFKPLRRGRSTATLEITSNALTQNGGKTSIPFIGYGVDTKPPVITFVPDTNAVPNAGSDAPIQNVSATDYSGILEFKILYRQSNELWDTVARKKDFPSNKDATLFIPGSSITQNGADYKIIAKDSAGNADTLSNGTTVQNKPVKFFSLPVKVSNKNPIPGFITPKITTQLKDAKRFYRMFSIPLNYNNVTAKDLWGYLGDFRYQWRFRVPVLPNPDGANYIDGENEVLKPEVSYFIITRSSSTISSPPGVSQRFDQFYKNGIDLQPGYNFIGNPFAFDIPIKKLKLLDTIQDLNNSSWFFNGMSSDPWIPQTPFQVWGGYCIKVINPTKLVVEEEIPDKAKTLQKETIDGWELQISANDGEQSDNYNYLGMRNSSKDTYDKNDIFEPPRFEDGLSICFPHDDWGKFSGAYSGDFRAVNSEGSTWDIKINADPNKIITLDINSITEIPKNFEISIYDKDFNRFLSVSKGYPTQLKLGSDKGARNLKLIIGTKNFINEENFKCKIIPVEFKLYQNYPNPFNPQTTIFYQIPSEGRVKIEIFNMLGEIVKILLDGQQAPGSYEVLFDAHSLASGVYFYKIKVSGAIEYISTQKMILMK